MEQPEVSKQNRRWMHKWGFVDTQFIIHADASIEMTGNRYNLCGYKMYYVIPFFEALFDFKFNLSDCLQEKKIKSISAPSIVEAFYQALQNNFSAEQYTLDNEIRLMHSHGQTSCEEVYKVLYESLERTVDLVFYPHTEQDVEKIIQLANQYNICLVPYGGGTNVTNALKIPSQETRMVVSLDMGRMNAIEWIDKDNRRACVQAGITGIELENQLAAAGFTVGHEPDSIELSTLGGWIATNASGMKKNKYGNIEDIVENFTLFTPSGKLEILGQHPRLAMGMNPIKLLIGNEGNLGVITKAIIKIHPKSKCKRYQAVIFPHLAAGAEFLKELNQKYKLPASIRLMDNLQFKLGQMLVPVPNKRQAFIKKLQYKLLALKKIDVNKMVAATLVFEGNHHEISLHEKQLLQLAKQYGGIKAGAENGKKGYNLTYAVAYIREFMFTQHIIGETFETTVSWDKIYVVYEAVLQHAQQKHVEYQLQGKPLICARITQLYHTGVCMYFSYAIYLKGIQNPTAIFSEIEHSFREVILKNGGSISHHHGIGKLRKDFMTQVLNKEGIKMLQGVKENIDPANIFGIRNNVYALE